MSTGVKITLAIVGGLALIALILGGGCVSMLNEEANLKNLVVAQQDAVKSYHDKMWKTVQQKAGVADKYSTDFDKIYPKLADSTYGGSQAQSTLFKFIATVQPNYDTSLLQDLSSSIESQREDLTAQELKLLDLNYRHNTMFDQWILFVPKSAILSAFGRTKTEVTLVTSTHTKDTFKNGGVDDNIEVFGK